VTFLADTHILIWALNQPTRLPETIRRCLEDTTSRCLYSPVSIWDMSTKYGLGKLTFMGHTPEAFMDALEASFFECLPLDGLTVATSYRLPRLHGDLFSRLLIWQAISAKVTLLSADTDTDQYVPLGLTVIH